MIKVPTSKTVIIKIILLNLAFFLVFYSPLKLWPSFSSAYHENTAGIVSCTSQECHPKECNNVQMEDVFEDKTQTNQTMSQNGTNEISIQIPSFLNDIGKDCKVGLVNMGEENLTEWHHKGENITISFEKVSESVDWIGLFPAWLDEGDALANPAICPEIPMPKFEDYGYMDVIVAMLPCKYPEIGWGRDVLRLQIHLIVANLLVKKVRGEYWNRQTKVVFLSKCMPMIELFRCSDFVRREGDWWYYKPEIVKLEQKVGLPVGACNIAQPLWEKGIHELSHSSEIQENMKTVKREAYASVLHSSEAYVCGAITLAQSLVRTGTKRDLILLIDSSISANKMAALTKAGWQLRLIERIRNPHAAKNTYNEYNYSKFRLWQLTDYERVIFIDSDIIVLKNLDVLFHFSEMSATENFGGIFNSGIMVIEPSNCTFEHMMQSLNEIVSYNGGDQGFLNEIFYWWHRLPKRVTFFKYFELNLTPEEVSLKHRLFGANPPKVYGIHYFGSKPWRCYRDYDCNWDVPDNRLFASDIAHRTWWVVHDAMDESLQRFCGLTKHSVVQLDLNREQARNMSLHDGHWKINITDPRRLNFNLLDNSTHI